MECTPQCKGMKLIIPGIVLILTRIYTTWDIWIVVGALLILMGIKKMIWSMCPCVKNNKKK